MRPEDRIWLAGLLEGEGSFTSDKTQYVRLSMTDQDVVERAADLLGSVVKQGREKRSNRKEVWTTGVTGPRARWIMIQMLPYMGMRRRQSIEKAMDRGPVGRAHPRSPYGKLPGSEPTRHGTRGIYEYWGCRCDACVEANRSHNRRWRAEKSTRKST